MGVAEAVPTGPARSFSGIAELMIVTSQIYWSYSLHRAKRSHVPVDRPYRPKHVSISLSMLVARLARQVGDEGLL